MLRKTGKTALFVAALALVASLFFVSCDNDVFGTNKPVDMTLSSTLMQYDSFSEIEGKILELEASVTLKSGAVSKDILWDIPTDTSAFKMYSSSNGKLVFEILKPGTYTVTASCSYDGTLNYKQVSCIIKTKDELTDLYIYNDATKYAFTAGSTISLTKDDSIVLAAGFNPEGTTQKNVLWSLDSTGVAELSINEKTGLATIKGTAMGTATLTLSSRDNTSISTSLKVAVQDSGADQSAGPSVITLAVPKPTVEIGKTSQINAIVKDSHGNTITDGTVEFSLDNDAAKAFSVKVNSSRVATVTAVKGGAGYLTATYKFTGSDGKEASITAKAYISVEGYVKSIGTDSGYLSLYKGTAETVAVSYNPTSTTQTGYKATVSNPDIVWINEDASSDNELQILAGDVGTATVTLTSIHDSSVSTTFNVKVSEIVSAASRVKRVVIGKSALTINPRSGYSSSSSAYDPVTLYASIFTTEDNGSETKNSRNYEVRFESSDNSIVEATNTSFFSSENGYSATLVAKKPGTAVIRAVSKDNPDAYAECTVTVGGELQGVVASRTAFNLTIGTSETITLTPNPLNAVCDIPVVSTSTDCVSAEIEKKNNIYYVKVTGNRLGTSMISFRNGNTLLTTVTVTVTEKEQVTARSLAFSGIYGSVYFAQDDSPITFKVNALDKDGKVINKNVLFKGRTTTAGQVTSLTSLGNNSFRISPKNAGSGDWIFYLEDSSVQSTLHVEVGGSAVQGTEARKIVAPTSAISLSLAATGKKNTTVTLSTIPLGTEASAGTVTWSASNDNVSVSRRGTGTQSYTATISALKAGSSIIKAETETGLKTEISVTVYDSESASDTTIAKAEIVSGSSSGWNRYTAAGKTFDLTAKAYYADGTEVKGELFTWTYSGDSITTKNAESSKGVLKDAAVGATFMTTKLSSYDKPATITARSVSNPKVYAVFKVYVVADEPTEETAFITAEYSGVTLALESEDNKSGSMEIGYTIQPVTYNASGLTVNSTSNCVKADLNTKSKKLKLTALSEGEAVVTVTDGTLSFSVDVTVVKTAQKQDASITALTLDRTYLSYDLADKEQQAITATVYKNGSPDTTEKVVWKSSDESVVKITSVGNIAYVIPQDKVGSAYIIATSESNKLVNAVCNVEVIDSSLLEKTLRSISLSESAVTLTPGAEIMLTVTGQPEGALENVKLTWTTSDKAVADVDKNGLVKAAGNGTAKITVSTAVNGKTLSSSCIVTVREDEVVTRVPAFITLSDSIVRVTQEQMDEVFTIHATVYDQYYEEIWGSSVLWTVENTGDIITYEKDALSLEYSPKNAGTAVVKASVGTIEAEAKIIVSVGKGSDKTLKSIVISAPSTLKTNESGTITATTIPADAEDALIWTSSDSAMTLKPSNNGRTVTAKASKAGTYTVTAKSFENETITASKVITVSDVVAVDKVTGVKLDARSIVLDLADKNMTVINATVYKGGKTSDGKVTWSVDDSLKNAITVRESGNSIYITKVSKGSGYITAKAVDDASVSAVCYVEVVDTSEIVVTGIEKAIISSTSLTIEEKGKHQFTVTTYPADIESSVIWSSSDESIATIDADGLLTAVKPGKCEITAAVHGGDNTITLTCSVYVYEKTAERKDNVTVARIEFDKSAVLLSQEKMDETVEVNATVYGSDGNVYKTGDDEEAVVTWILENKSIATLTYQNNKAVLSPKSAGNGYLTAMYKGRSNSILVVTGTAEEADTSAKALKFSPETLTLKVGGTTTVTALVEPSGADAEYAFSITEGSDVISASYSKNSIRITGKKAGVAKIKAILVNKPEITAELEVKVLESTAGVVTAITLDKSFISMELDTKDLTTVTATAYVDGKVSKDAQLAWSLEDITTAEVGYTVLGSNTVSLTKKAVGSGYLVCKAVGNEDVYAKCRIEIKEAQAGDSPATIKAKKIVLSDTYLKLSQEKMDQVYTINAAVYGTDNKVMDSAVSWTVEGNDNIDYQASDNQISFSALSAGTTVITASVGEVKSSARVIVGSEYTDTTLKGYTLKPARTVLEVGSKMLLTLLTAPAEADADTLWTVDNENIELVEEDGKLYMKAKAVGTSVVTATDRNNSTIQAESTITIVAKGSVAPDTITSVALDKTNIVLDLAEKNLTLLKAVVAKNYKASTGAVTWTIDDSLNGVITTTETGANTLGIVKGTKTGSGYITATSADNAEFWARCYVEVIDSTDVVVTRMTSVVMSSDSATMIEGDTLQLAAKAYPIAVRENAVIEWSSSDITVATVDDAGLVTAVAAGKAKITATVSFGTQVITSHCNITVVNAPADVVRIALSDSELTLRIGEAYEMKTAFIPENTEAEITWKSSDTAIARVSDNGIITGVAKGTATITASVLKRDGDVVKAEAVVTVVENQGEVIPGSIRLSSYSIELSQKEPDKSKTVTATVIATDGYPVEGAVVTWTLENEDVVTKTIDGNAITLLPADAGTTTLRAWYGNLVSSASVYTSVKPGTTLDHLTTVPNSNITVQTGTEQPVEVRTYPVGLTITPEWTSDDNAVATVTKDGDMTASVKGVKQGDAVVTVKDIGTGLSTELNVRVRDDIKNIITAVVLDKTAISFDLAEKSMANVSASVYVNNTLTTDGITLEWEVLNEEGTAEEDLLTVVPVNAAKSRVALAPKGETGRAYLRATASNGTDTNYAQVYVEVVDSSTAPVKITELRCETDAATLPLGSSRTYSTITTPSGIDADIRWEIVNQNPEEGYTNVLTMDAYGSVTAVGLGEAVIKAYVYGSTPEVSDTMKITVVKIDNTKPDSQWEIGSIQLSPARITLEQDAEFPTAVTATIYDKQGEELKNETVDWNTEGLTVDGKVIAKVVKTEGNTVYLEGVNAGRGELIASRQSSDGTIKSASAYVVTGGIVTYDEEHITALSFNTSSPQYLVAGDGKKVVSSLEYTPASMKEKGVAWTSSNAVGYINYATSAEGITAEGLKATESGKDAELTAVSVGTTEEGTALEAKQAYRVVATVDDLPAATSLKLDKTSIVFNLAEKNLVVVTATAYDYYGNEVPTAVIQWEIVDETTEDLVGITKLVGASTGVRRGTVTGTATLRASLMNGTEVVAVNDCYITVIDSAEFEGISASANEIRLTVGGTATVSLYGTPSSRFKGANFEVSGNTDAVEVTPDTNGKVFKIAALQEGTAVVTYIAEVDGMEYTVATTVYVNSEDASGVDRISFTPASAYLEKVGDTVELTTIVYDKKANVLSENVIYKVSDPSVVDITETQTGLTVTAKKSGTATITATVGNVSAESFIMVGEENVPVDVLAKIIPAQNEIELKKNQSKDIMLVTVPEGYSMAGFTVTSSKKTVAEGAIVNGMLHITALNEGETVITVSEGEVKAEVAVKVSGVAKPAVVKFDKTGVTLTQETGSKETVTAYVYDEDMVLLEGEKIALWQTGDSAVVRIAETTDNTVTVEPLNTGSTTVTASAGTVSSSFTVTVNDVVKNATAPSSIKAAEANVQVKKGESTEVSVLFEPTNITDEGKDLEWTSSNTAVAKVEELSTGKAVVTGIKAGTALITAKSTKNDSAATFNVTVKNSGVYAIELDKTEIRLGYGTETMLTATLTLDGEKIDASDVSWSLEGTDPAASLGFRQNNTVTNTVTGNTATLVAMTGHPAYVYVVASYDTTAARAQVEVADISKQSTGITSVSLDKSLVRIEVGESVSFTASTLPETAGVTYEWKVAPNAEDEGAVSITGIAGNTLTVEASKVGTVDVSVTAKLAGFEDKTSDIAKIEIVEKGAMETVYKYSYVALDKSTVTMIPNGDYAIFYATLYDSENKEIEGTVSAWNVLDSRGKLLFSWEADDNGENYVWSTGESYETFDKLLEEHADCAFSRMTVVGSDNAMLEITPTKPGTYFVEVEGPVEDAENPEKTVKARAMISVTNDLTSVSLDSSVLHMILGEQITVNASLNPEDAELKSSAWMETGDITRLELTNETPESVEVRAVTLGETGIRYTAQDTIGTIRETDMKITVHDAGYGKGGIRKLAFDNVYETASYPYSTDVYTAKAYFMDGTSAESSAITYKIQHADETDLDSFESKNGMVYSTGDEEMKNGSHNGTLVATYSITESGIRITPHGKGMIKVVASYVQDEITYTAAMWLTVTGNTTTLSPSSSSIVLYTGGSTEITLTTDNNVNETYTVDLVEEYTSGGYKIVNNQLEGTTTYMPSVFTDASTGTKSGRSITIGTKAFVPETAFNDKDAETAVQVVNPKNSSASAADFYLMPGGNSITKSQWEDIRGSFPRTATFKVATADGQASSYITVTVNQLPSGNTYPVNLTLSADKVDLTPPFSTEQTVSATLTDLDGKTTKGTVDWYYYPVGREYNEVGDDGALMYKLDTKAVTGTVTGEASELIEAYFSADGLTLYYKPKQSGLYRLTAKCIQNPQLESTATLNVGGGVTGVTASAGTSLTIDKGTSAVVTAVFTPTGALARHAVFGVRETIDEKNYVKIIDDVQYENNYISVTVNKGEDISDTATVYGKLTTGANRQLMRVIYPQTTEYESMMKNAFESGEDIYWTISDSTMKAWKRTDGTMSAYVNEKGVQVAIQVFSYATTIDVTTPKTNYTFKVAGTTSIDPSAITGNSLNYTVTTTSDNSSSDSFSEWSWVEAKLIGEETEQVYASSVPVNADGESLYQWKDEKGNLLSDKYYTASELKELNAGGTAEGVSASSIKNYNSAKTVYRFFKGAGCSILGNDEYKDLSKALVTSNEDCTKYYYQDGSEIIYDSVYDVQKSSDGTYFYYANGKETVVTPGTTEYNKGYLAAAAVPVKLSGLANGKLVAENGNQTFSFILNSNAVPDEPLLFKVGVGDKVLENNENGEYFDYEAKTYTPSDQRLYIGGDIQTISAGTSTLSNNGSSTQQTATGSMLSLIEGASAILTLEFNPEYTHQKEVTWSVLDGSGQMETDEYSAIPSADSSSLTFIAYKLADGLTKTINLRATSVYNSSVYCDYTIVIQCVVKNITFTAKALKQINGKGNTYVVPEYSEMADPAYPNQVSDNHIDCYDYTDVAGDGVTVDAYMIEMEPTPAYGYTFTAEIVKGSDVGRIDTTDIDESDNKFRFIPKGRVYSQYTATGEPDSLSYDVTYGDVVVKVSCDDLNYSKEFTINYGAAAGRLVREVDEPFAATDKGNKVWQEVWDTANVGGMDYLYGLDAIVMYEGESFPVTMVDYDNGRKGSSLTHWSANTNMAENSAMMWYVADGNGNVCLDGSSYYTTSDASKGVGTPVWEDGQDEKTRNWNGGLVYSVADGRKDDPRVVTDSDGVVLKESGETYTGLYGTVCTLTAKKQGIYTLYYSYVCVLTDDDGKPQVDTTGRAACVVTKGSIPVYVISKASQTLIASFNALYKADTGKTAFPFIKQNISKTNLDKWFMPSIDSVVGDETNRGNIDRGVTYLVFDYDHDYTSNANIGKYYTGIHKIQLLNEGALDFSSLTAGQFAYSFMADLKTVRGINGETVTVTGMATDAENENDKYTRVFKQAEFEDLVLTCENGLAMFSAINSFVVGPQTTGENSGTKSVNPGNWLQNNLDETNTLDFSGENIKNLTLKNLDLGATEEILLTDNLEALNFQNITYLNGIIKVDGIELSSDEEKTVKAMSFNDYYSNNLKINNVKSLKSLTLNGDIGVADAAGTELSLKNLSGGKDGTAIDWPGKTAELYFETVEIENVHFSEVSLNLKNTKTITLKDVCSDGRIIINGDNLTCVILENVSAAGIEINGEKITDVTLKDCKSTGEVSVIGTSIVNATVNGLTVENMKKTTLTCGAAENVFIDKIVTDGAVTINGGVTLDKTPRLSITSSTIDKLSIGIVSKEVSTSYKQGFSAITISGKRTENGPSDSSIRQITVSAKANENLSTNLSTVTIKNIDSCTDVAIRDAGSLTNLDCSGMPVLEKVVLSGSGSQGVSNIKFSNCGLQSTNGLKVSKGYAQKFTFENVKLASATPVSPQGTNNLTLTGDITVAGNSSNLNFGGTINVLVLDKAKMEINTLNLTNSNTIKAVSFIGGDKQTKITNVNMNDKTWSWITIGGTTSNLAVTNFNLNNAWIASNSEILPKIVQITNGTVSARGAKIMAAQDSWSLTSPAGCKKIDLAGATITNSGSTCLKVSIASLETFIASNCGLIKAEISKDCKNLTYLDMSNNKFGTSTGHYVKIGDMTYASNTSFGEVNRVVYDGSNNCPTCECGKKGIHVPTAYSYSDSYWDTETVDCSICDGTGEVNCSNCGGDGIVMKKETASCNCGNDPACGTCGGHGKYTQENPSGCMSCSGSGTKTCGSCSGSGTKTTTVLKYETVETSCSGHTHTKSCRAYTNFNIIARNGLVNTPSADIIMLYWSGKTSPTMSNLESGTVNLSGNGIKYQSQIYEKDRNYAAFYFKAGCGVNSTYFESNDANSPYPYCDICEVYSWGSNIAGTYAEGGNVALFANGNSAASVMAQFKKLQANPGGHIFFVLNNAKPGNCPGGYHTLTIYPFGK